MENTKRKRKIGLALSGGSALGIAHIGAIEVLNENGIVVDCISGTSAGALVAALFAFGVPVKKMVEISKKISWSEISDFSYSKMGLNTNAPVGEIIRRTIGNVNIEDALIPLALITTDIDTGEKVVLKKGNLAQAVMASSCIPMFFVPIKIRGRNLVDGGLVENLPLSPLKEMGAEIEIGVDMGFWTKFKKTHNVLDVIHNAFSVMISHQRMAADWGSSIIVQPHLEKFTSSDFKKGSELIKVGHLAMSAKIAQIKKEMKKPNRTDKNFWKKTWNFLVLQRKWK